jgi:hypothetical protein
MIDGHLLFLVQFMILLIIDRCQLVLHAILISYDVQNFVIGKLMGAARLRFKPIFNTLLCPTFVRVEDENLKHVVAFILAIYDHSELDF